MAEGVVQMTIDITKKYITADGKPVKIYEIVETTQRYPVLGAVYTAGRDEWAATTWKKDGRYGYGTDSCNLIEVPARQAPPIDTKVLVWDNWNGGVKHKQHSAGMLTPSGGLQCYPEGKTSWSYESDKHCLNGWSDWEVAE
jgi:hypothetical protein